MSLRDDLIAIINGNGSERHIELNDDTSLIESKLLDSMALFNLALFIEGNIHNKLDLTEFDLSIEWTTIGNILNFIEIN